MSDMVGDLHWMAAKAVEDLIKKDGEIAKRDEELAACRVAVENCEVLRAQVAELEDDLKGAHSMLAEVSKAGMALRAELSALKAQGVVMPEPTDSTLDTMRREGLSIDGDNAYKRDLLDSVIGALAFGKQRSAPPPAGHWLERFYEIGRAEADERDQLYAAPVSEAKAQEEGK